MIRLENVSKQFPLKKGDGIIALDQINLEIDPGEIFGIIGYSGAGKSTLIRMLNLLEKPSQGKIWINGEEMLSLSDKELRKRREKIGMIFQHFNLLWSRTVYGNIAFPLEIAGWPKEKIGKRVKELLHLVGLEDKEHVYPSQLSGGQKQRVGIARALANEPNLLLSDEATSALDPKTTDSILELLQKINRELGITIVLITHEMHVVQKICHRVAVLEKGRIVEKGTVLEVFSNPKADITKEFVQQVMDLHQWEEVLSPNHRKRIIQCSFLGENAQQPIISQMIKRFDIDVNILQGKINRIQQTSYGSLILELSGDAKEQERAIQYLRDHHIRVEHMDGEEVGKDEF
ncbi:methionine ABC transporter (ATP-binding protein) [[Clostridium] ultunense Esp]|uniref:methionine ABC transporter ATP-binding protein n=1 Tax=Thermicanus aegyptius TaxID=94009 RepID=UPI0002B70934|nr:methionine ABC transporter ATP-binding protein [Thermicanus aegyptius]CCQ96362.1 methionine ABC transporter (ATP-binding protein) [[Clostridium] ultunense Esp]